MLRARQRRGKYRIERRLADGPMASVYQAYDTIHGVSVALKIPNPKLMDDYFLADFRKEVRLLAGLDHPNILAIYDFGSHDGVAFAAMELLRGETLAERLSAGPLPPRTVPRRPTSRCRRSWASRRSAWRT